MEATVLNSYNKMSWPMQPGPWNTGLGVPSDINMASYTPEQWAMLQQQNWQQWTQWQQQYAQWQNQCGEKVCTFMLMLLGCLMVLN